MSRKNPKKTGLAGRDDVLITVQKVGYHPTVERIVNALDLDNANIGKVMKELRKQLAGKL